MSSLPCFQVAVAPQPRFSSILQKIFLTFFLMAAGRLGLGNGNAGCHVWMTWQFFGGTFALFSKHTIAPMTTFGYRDLSKLCLSVLSLPLKEQPRVSSTHFSFHTWLLVCSWSKKPAPMNAPYSFPTHLSHAMVHSTDKAKLSPPAQKGCPTVGISHQILTVDSSSSPVPALATKKNLHLFSGSWLSCRHWWLWFDLCL